jgi:hypothetical protein
MITASSGSARRTFAGILPNGVMRLPSGDGSQTPSMRPSTTRVGEIHPCGRDTADFGPALIWSSCRVLPTMYGSNAGSRWTVFDSSGVSPGDSVSLRRPRI